jgi:pilus assembly protein CpaC
MTMMKRAPTMANWTLCRAAAPLACQITFIALAVTFDFAVAAQRAPAQVPEPAPGVKIVASEFGSNFVPLGIGKSVVVDLPHDVKDVLVADPKIANAVIRTARRAYLIGVGLGQTNIYFFDADGRQLAGFDIAVTRDLNGMRGALKQMFPDGNVRVEAISDGVMLTGVVASAVEAQQAFDIAGRLVGDNTKVVNGIVVRGREQVMLKVTVAEVERDVIKQLGIDLSGSLGKNAAVVNFATDNPFSAALQNISNTTVTGQLSSVAGTLRAMDRAGVIRTLAEPTLSAISGESATFLAGGEFPLPSGLQCSAASTTNTTQVCQISVGFKKFGVSLTFTPVVLSESRISLKVMTEVSDLSSDNSLVMSNLGTLITIPSIRVRRADTTVEIPSGGALALAGMIEEQTKQQINGFPGLMQVPILGSLFRSRDYVNSQTELMILVTPYVVRAVSQKELSKPDDGFADAPDPSTVLLGRLNRLYGVAGPAGPIDPLHSYRGNYGFILD